MHRLWPEPNISAPYHPAARPAVPHDDALLTEFLAELDAASLSLTPTATPAPRGPPLPSALPADPSDPTSLPFFSPPAASARSSASPTSSGADDLELNSATLPMPELERRLEREVPDDLFKASRAEWARFLQHSAYDAATRQLLQVMRRRKLTRQYAEVTRQRRRARVRDTLRVNEELQAENERLAAENADLRAQLQLLQQSLQNQSLCNSPGH